MKKLALLLGFLSPLAFAIAQDATQILDQSGIKVSYVATKKEEDKKHDKWEIKITVDNTGASDMIFLNTGPNLNYVKVEVPNKKGLFTVGMKEFSGESTGQTSIDGAGLCRTKGGVINESFNTQVEKGATPEVKASLTKQFQPRSQVQLLKVPANELTADRNWLISTGGGAPSEQSAIRFIGWDNAQYAAFYDGMQFRVAPAADLNNVTPVPSINFLGWDRSRILARSENGSIILSRDGMGGNQVVTQLNFLGGDGYNYSAMLKPINNNRMMQGDVITVTQSRRSQNGAYYLILQADGNMALINAQNQPIWSSGTSGKPANKLTMQSDGNLVIYGPTGVATWASNTNGKGGAYLIVQNDGNLVMYNGSGDPVWFTNTRGR